MVYSTLFGKAREQKHGEKIELFHHWSNSWVRQMEARVVGQCHSQVQKGKVLGIIPERVENGVTDFEQSERRHGSDEDGGER